MKQSLDEFLAKRGLSFLVSDYMLDKFRHPHGLTYRQRKKLELDNRRATDEYLRKRNAAMSEYNRLVERGEITPKSDTEILLEKARYGHPDNESTQAARRVCEKRGLEWTPKPEPPTTKE